MLTAKHRLVRKTIDIFNRKSPSKQYSSACQIFANVGRHNVILKISQQPKEALVTTDGKEKGESQLLCRCHWPED